MIKYITEIISKRNILLKNKYAMALFFMPLAFNITVNASQDGDLFPHNEVANSNKRVATGIIYKIQSLRNANNNCFVLNTHDADNYRVLKGPYTGCDSQKWVMHLSETSGFYKLQTVRDFKSREKRVLSAHDAGNSNVEKHPYIGCNSQKWVLRSTDSRDFFRIQSLRNANNKDGVVLNTHDADNSRVLKGPYIGCDSQKFHFVPIAYKLKAAIEDFQYDKMVYNLGSLARKVSAVVWEMQNHSDESTDVHRPQINEKTINSSSWSFSESKERSFFNQLDVDVSASFLDIFKGKAHNTSTWNSKTTSLKETRRVEVGETVVSLTSEITIPPRKKVEYILTWEKVEASIPFEAKVKLMGFADCLKKNGDIAHMAQVDADGVRALLYNAGGDVSILGTEGKTLIAKITGSVHLDGAIRGVITKKEYNL